MRVEATAEAAEVVERAGQERTGRLVITIGTGCCESTAPFLYEDFWPGPTHEQVGEAAGVGVYAPEELRRLYGDDEVLVLDVVSDELAESMSIETEYSCRLTLRVPGQETAGPAACDTPGKPRGVVGEMPEALRSLKFR